MRLAEAGLDGVRMLLQVHDELVFEVPDGREEEAAAVIRRGDGERRRACDEARRAARRRGRLGRALGRSALTDARARRTPTRNRRPTPTWRRLRAAGGSTSSASCFGSRRRCRSCSSPAGSTAPAALGRFAYAVLIVEFAAQIAALGPEARARPAARQCEEAAGLRRRRRAAGRGDRRRLSAWRS